MGRTRSLIPIVLFWVLAHNAESGWSYPENCCGNTHCHQVACDELLELNDGRWKWGEFTFPKSVIQPSGDRRCHVCINGTLPLCAFVQQGY